MKRIFQLIIFSLFVGISAPAQTIKFMGIPVDGTPASFAQKLIAKGAKRATPNNNGDFIMDFAGYSNCEVYVFAVHNKVAHVGVNILEADNWNKLYTTYRIFKNRLTKKYGQPDYELENMLESTSSDYEKFDAIQNGKSFGCQFNKENGTVKLMIGYFSHSYKGYVAISYVNPKNDAASDDDL